ncbi:hypothetical protein ESP62_008605 [Aeromicrobium fastidiosum]|uniref:Uncharacterized protein n=1 Tax=Aeromicrobium fastidiosum TaxID=52699 RepID=A0A641AMA9_9ACTN|nr:hypothetical protein ESP62_008605 [Aeromicrobium fastidiosum]
MVPVAGQTDGQAAEPTSPVAEPTVVIPAEEPAPAQAAASEPTSVFSAQPAQPAYPAAQPAYPAAQPLYAEAQPAQTAAFGAVPPGGDGQPPAGTPGGGAKKSLPVAAVIALTVLVVLLIGGAAFGATKIFGGDDDDPPVSAGDNKTTDAPDADDETDEPSDPTPTPSATTDAPGGTGSSSEFCTELGNIQTKSLEAFSGGSTPDLSKIQDTARELVEAYDDLGDIAPPEIKSDIEVMSKFLNSMMNPSGGAPTGMDEYIGAAQRIGTYYAQNCL